jgi:RNA polymerase sigma-70 factor (ECF subfamily)
MNAAAAARVAVAGMPGSESADFAAWVRPYWSDMQLLARRLCGPDAGEDAVQEALAAAWRKRAQFDPHRGTPRSWLLAVVADQAHKQRRRLRVSAPMVDEDLRAVPDIQSEVSMDLSVVLRQLTERQRLAVSLFYYLDISVAEIAQVMGCSIGTVKSTLSDARQRLRVLLGEEYR